MITPLTRLRIHGVCALHDAMLTFVQDSSGENWQAVSDVMRALSAIDHANEETTAWLKRTIERHTSDVWVKLIANRRKRQRAANGEYADVFERDCARVTERLGGRVGW